MTTAPAPTTTIERPPVAWPDGDALLRGYRWKRVRGPDGRETSVQVPLNRRDFLNPQEGDVMPESTFHENATTALRDMLRVRYASDAHTAVFHDLIFRWGIPGLDEPSPDIAVVPGVREREKNRSVFRVPDEGARPVLVIEVVSPHYRHEDLVDKVDIYERAGVQEYVILEQRALRGATVDLATGYRLVGDRYRPILLEDDGRMRLETVGLYISLQGGKVALEDVETGEPLRTIEEAEVAHRRSEARALAEAEARALAEARARAEAEARALAEARIEALEGELARLRPGRPE